MKSGMGMVDKGNFFLFFDNGNLKCTYNCSFIKINEANKKISPSSGQDCSWLRTIDLETLTYLTISFLNILSCFTPFTIFFLLVMII